MAYVIVVVALALVMVNAALGIIKLLGDVLPAVILVTLPLAVLWLMRRPSDNVQPAEKSGGGGS